MRFMYIMRSEDTPSDKSWGGGLGNEATVKIEGCYYQTLVNVSVANINCMSLFH